MEPETSKTKPLSKEETKGLLSLIEGSRIIISKKTNGANNKMKLEEWTRIAGVFNANMGTCRRTPQQLRLKWENLKKNSRKCSTLIRMERIKVRGKPLSKEETKSLLGLIENSKVILSKTTNATNNKMKTEEWLRLANRFNATATVHRRTPQQLRLKWENLKKNARKRSTKIRMNRIQTGGGAPDYIPPDDVLDRVADLLGSTATGFIVPFGGDKEPDIYFGGDGDGSGDGFIGGQAEVLPINYIQGLENSVPVSIDTGMSTSIPVFIDTNMSSAIPVSNDTDASTSVPVPLDLNEVSGCALTGGSGPVMSVATPKRLTLGTPRTGKKKSRTADDGKASRNNALAEYYILKKLCLDAKLQNILLQNENFKLENENMKLENKKLKLEIEQLSNKR